MVNEKRIILHGLVGIVSDKHNSNRFSTVQCRNLLAYLAMNADIEHPRERLIKVLWQVSINSATRNKLSVTLHHLKRFLEENGVVAKEVLALSRHSVRFSTEHIEVDYLQFSTAINKARIVRNHNDKRDLYRRALMFYRAPLLVDINTDWSALRQFEARQSFHDAALWIALDAHESGKTGHAKVVLSDALSVEPNSEKATELLTNWYTQTGEPELAIACAKQLRRAMTMEDRSLSKAMVDRIAELNLILANSTKAIVFADELTLTVLSINKKATRSQIQILEHHNGRKSLDDTCWLFGNPVLALEAGKEVTLQSPNASALIHTTIMSENEEPPSICTSAFKVIKEGELFSTEASMYLLKSRGVEPKDTVDRSIRLYKYS